MRCRCGLSALADNATEAQQVVHRNEKKKDKKVLELLLNNSCNK